MDIHVFMCLCVCQFWISGEYFEFVFRQIVSKYSYLSGVGGETKKHSEIPDSSNISWDMYILILSLGACYILMVLWNEVM